MLRWIKLPRRSKKEHLVSIYILDFTSFVDSSESHTASVKCEVFHIKDGHVPSEGCQKGLNFTLSTKVHILIISQNVLTLTLLRYRWNRFLLSLFFPLSEPTRGSQSLSSFESRHSKGRTNQKKVKNYYTVESFLHSTLSTWRDSVCRPHCLTKYLTNRKKLYFIFSDVSSKKWQKY